MDQQDRNRQLVEDIKEFLVEEGMQEDVRIYFNGKSWDWLMSDEVEPNVIEDIDPSDYFDYVHKGYVSMSFEGALYHLLNRNLYTDALVEEFEEVFKKHGMYFEMGNAWNLTVFDI